MILPLFHTLYTLLVPWFMLNVVLEIGMAVFYLERLRCSWTGCLSIEVTGSVSVDVSGEYSFIYRPL